MSADTRALPTVSSQVDAWLRLLRRLVATPRRPLQRALEIGRRPDMSQVRENRVEAITPQRGFPEQAILIEAAPTTTASIALLLRGAKQAVYQQCGSPLVVSFILSPRGQATCFTCWVGRTGGQP